LGTAPSEQERYIAKMLQRGLTLKHHVPSKIIQGSLKEKLNNNPVICVGTRISNPEVARLCTIKNISDSEFTQKESYAIDFIKERGKKWIIVAGEDSIGCIYGGYSLMQLITSDKNSVGIDLFSIRDYPSVNQRSLRGIGEYIGMKLQLVSKSHYLGRFVTATEIHDDQLMIPCLDWLAQNRINYFHVLAGLKYNSKLPSRLPHLVHEAHRRGIKIVGGFRPVGGGEGGETHPCYCKEEDIKKVLGFYEQFLDAGCDAVYFMADDYEKDKLKGHCEKCIAKFGGLAGEQQFILHKIIDLAHKKGLTDDDILFCPTFYDINRLLSDRYKPFAAKDYLNTFDKDPIINKILFTFTHSGDDIKRQKELFPNLRYSIFYNGPRWLTYYFREPPELHNVLERFYHETVYFPIYYGWHAAQYEPRTGWFIDTTDTVHRNFSFTIPNNTSLLMGNIANYADSIFKGDIEYAMWGHYCWDPAEYDTRQSEIAIGDALFGEGNGQYLAWINRLFLDLVRIFFLDFSLDSEFTRTIPDKLSLVKFLYNQLQNGYCRYQNKVSPEYIPPVRDFYVHLGMTRIKETINELEVWYNKRIK